MGRGDSYTGKSLNEGASVVFDFLHAGGDGTSTSSDPFPPLPKSSEKGSVSKPLETSTVHKVSDLSTTVKASNKSSSTSTVVRVKESADETVSKVLESADKTVDQVKKVSESRSVVGTVLGKPASPEQKSSGSTATETGGGSEKKINSPVLQQARPLKSSLPPKLTCDGGITEAGETLETDKLGTSAKLVKHKEESWTQDSSSISSHDDISSSSLDTFPRKNPQDPLTSTKEKSEPGDVDEEDSASSYSGDNGMSQGEGFNHPQISPSFRSIPNFWTRYIRKNEVDGLSALVFPRKRNWNNLVLPPLAEVGFSPSFDRPVQPTSHEVPTDQPNNASSSSHSHDDERILMEEVDDVIGDEHKDKEISDIEGDEDEDKQTAIEILDDEENEEDYKGRDNQRAVHVPLSGNSHPSNLTTSSAHSTSSAGVSQTTKLNPYVLALLGLTLPAVVLLNHFGERS